MLFFQGIDGRIPIIRMYLLHVNSSPDVGFLII